MSNDNQPLADALPDIASWSKGYASGYARAVADLTARRPVGCDACSRSGIRQDDEGRNIYCPNCDLGRACAGYGPRPPAQTLDLGGVREALQAAEGLAIICASIDCYASEELATSGRAMRQQFADALALIDSQAVSRE